MSEAITPSLYVGVDWATEKHDVCALRPDGTVVGERTFRNTATGLADLAEWLVTSAGTPPAAVWVAIETPHGPVVDTLLERGFCVFALNPKQLDRFRDRFTTAGAKDDRRDARVLADSLRTDRQAFRRLEPDAAEVVELREWSRMAEDLQEERTRLTNRLREQLRRFFPQVLELTDDLSEPWVLDLLAAIPTPDAARRARASTIAKILKANRIRRIEAEQVKQALCEPAVTVAPGTIAAATAHISLVRDRLRLVNEQISRCHRHLEALCDRLAATGDETGRAGEQRDVEILRSLPGVGRIVLATLLAEAAQPLKTRDYHALRSLSGIAPVTRRSGKRLIVIMRQACHSRLRNALYHWARVASQCDPHWKARYAELRQRGHSHGRACRGVADRLLKVAMAMLRGRTLYDPNRHAPKAEPAAA